MDNDTKPGELVESSGTPVTPPTPEQQSVPAPVQPVQPDAMQPVAPAAAPMAVAPARQESPLGEAVLSEAPEDMPAVSHPVPSHRRLVHMLLVGLIMVIVIAAVGAGAFHFGDTKGYDRGKAVAQLPTKMPLKVPAGASVIAQCTPGEGMQYIAPKDIPMGPIYNVWQGKVVGLEYMLPESDIAKGQGLDMSALSQEYDHVDVMYEAKGHAGLTEPHYHILLSMLTYDQEKHITCGQSTDNVHDMMNMNGM